MEHITDFVGNKLFRLESIECNLKGRMEEDNGEAGGVIARQSGVIDPDMPQLGLPIAEANPGSMKIEQTLCLIKPDAMKDIDEIINILQREGFAILNVGTIMGSSHLSQKFRITMDFYSLQARRVRLNAEQTSQFYQDNYELPWFSDAVAYLYSGPIMALILSGPGAIKHLNYVLGPELCKVCEGPTTMC